MAIQEGKQGKQDDNRSVPAEEFSAVVRALRSLHAGKHDEAMQELQRYLDDVQRIVPRRDLSLRELQTQLPWTVHYHHDFRASPMAHKDFGHALLHIMKAAGKLAAVVNDAEHGGSEFTEPEVDRYVADFVVCALRMANTCPGRVIDLQRAVEDRIENKNQAELRREPQ